MHSVKKKKRHFFTYFICFLIIVTIFLLTIPTILSSPFGTSLAEEKLSKRFKGEVKITKLQLSWFNTQKIEGLEYSSSDKMTVFSFKSLDVKDPLWNLFLHSNPHELISLDSPVLNIKQKPQEASIKPSETTKANKKNDFSMLMLLMENFYIQNANVSFISGKKSVQFNNVDLRLKINTATPSTLLTKGITQSNDTKGTFDVESSFSKDSIYKATINTVNFPLWIFDDLLHLEGLLTQALGPMLNTETACSFSEEIFNVSTELSSANLKASIHTGVVNNVVSLVKPASISLTFTPDLFLKTKMMLGIKKSLRMTKEAYLQLTLDAISIPYENRSLKFKNISYNGQLTSSPLDFSFSDKLTPVSINSFAIASSTKNLSNAIDVSIQSSFNYLLKNPSSVNTSFTIGDPFSKTLSHKNFLKELRLEVTKFPLVFLDTIAAKSPVFVNFLGDVLSLKIASSNGIYTANLDSPRLQIPESIFSLDDYLSIKKPTSFVYTPSKDLLTSHLSFENLKVTQTGTLQGTLESFNFALKDLKHLGTNNLNFLLKLKSDAIGFHSLIYPGLFSLKNTTISIVADDLKHFNIETFSTLSHLDEVDPKKVLFKEPLRVVLNTIIDADKPNQIQIPLIECKFQNSKLTSSFVGAFEDHFTKIVFLKPFEVEFLPSSENIYDYLHSLNPQMNYVFTLPMKMVGNLQPLYLNKPLFEQLIIDAQIGLEKFDLIDKAYFKEFSFLNTSAKLQANIKKKDFLCSIESYPIAKEARKGVILCKISSNDLSSFQQFRDSLHLAFSYKDIPSSLIDAVLGYKQALNTILGPIFEGELNINQKGIHSFINSKVLSSNINLTSGFSISNHILELTKPLELDITLTEDSHSAFEEIFGEGDGNENFQLVSPSLLRITAKKLHWPLNHDFPKKLSLKEKITKITHHLNNSFFYVIAKTDHMVIQSNINQELTALDDFVLECSKINQQSPLLFNLNSHVTDETKDSINQKGHITASATLQSTKDTQDRPMLISKADAKLDHFPTMLFDSFFQIMGFKQLPPSLFLGKQVSATLKTDLENLSGNIDFDVNSTDCKGNLNIFLTDGVVKLYKPIQAKLNLSPKLADVFLKNMNFDLQVAKNPLELFISERGFYFPLDPFDLKGLQIREAQLSLGQIICTNRGNPYQISGFFKLGLNHNLPIALWFAPMDFSINNGYLAMDRTEVLFNNAYQIAFWGKINIVQKTVDMILGLTEQSIRKAFGIRSLPRDFVLQIPMGGPIGNVRINGEVAAARIAVLAAKASGQGGLWGGIAGALSDFANDQESVPNAKPPFPWQDSLSKYEEQEKFSTTVNIIK